VDLDRTRDEGVEVLREAAFLEDKLPSLKAREL
jgi:hypothetical protein